MSNRRHTVSVSLPMLHSHVKVINHLEEKSRKSRMVIMNCLCVLPDEIINACDAEDAAKACTLVRRGRRRHHAGDAVLRLSGPLIRGAYVVVLGHKSSLRTQTSTVDDDIVNSHCSRSGAACLVAHLFWPTRRCQLHVFLACTSQTVHRSVVGMGGWRFQCTPTWRCAALSANP